MYGFVNLLATNKVCIKRKHRTSSYKKLLYPWEETHVYLWLIHIVIQQKPTQDHKVIILQLKF